MPKAGPVSSVRHRLFLPENSNACADNWVIGSMHQYKQGLAPIMVVDIAARAIHRSLGIDHNIKMAGYIIRKKILNVNLDLLYRSGLCMVIDACCIAVFVFRKRHMPSLAMIYVGIAPIG
jgi:hypothetical protein